MENFQNCVQQSKIVGQMESKIKSIKNYCIPNIKQTTSLRSTIATVDLEKLRYNVDITKKYIQEKFNPDAKLMAVVKSNAYGHGSVGCAPDMILAGVDWLAVVTMDEAIELRLAGISAPILLFGVFEPHITQLYFEYDITPTLFCKESVEWINQYAEETDQEIECHIKVDTGMSRIGFQLEEFRKMMNPETWKKQFSKIKINGIMSHMSSSDEVIGLEYTKMQNIEFQKIVQEFEKFLPKIDYPNDYYLMKHLSNSSTTLKTVVLPFQGNVFRVGDVLYGGKRGEYDGINWYWNHKPILELSSVIGQLKTHNKGDLVGYNRAFECERESKIAVIPIGYGDGMQMGLSNKGKMIVINEEGEEFEAPIAGKVCMDLIMLDVTDVPKVKQGDKVIIVGRHITQEVIARWCNTNPSAVTCQIGLRIPRIYINSLIDEQQYEQS